MGEGKKENLHKRLPDTTELNLNDFKLNSWLYGLLNQSIAT